MTRMLHRWILNTLIRALADDRVGRLRLIAVLETPTSFDELTIMRKVWKVEP